MLALQLLQHQQLVMEVVSQLQRMFKPDLKLIKRQIESLVDREYLERDKEQNTLFKASVDNICYRGIMAGHFNARAQDGIK